MIDPEIGLAGMQLCIAFSFVSSAYLATHCLLLSGRYPVFSNAML